MWSFFFFYEWHIGNLIGQRHDDRRRGSPLDKTRQMGYNYIIKCLQSDVVKILNTSGAVVASYTYDAWGKVTASGSIGQINPIRYRGYYYDTDTGFYYLQSRYYDPAIKRFISADDTDNLGANRDFTSLNLYAYCGNNPIMRYDPYGYAWYHTVLNNLKGKMHRFSQTDLGKEILDVFSIVVSNVTIEGGICIGMNIGATINGVGFDVGTRMDIAGVEIKDGKIRFGHFGKSGGVLSAGVLAVGEESHTYENFGSTKRETTGSQTVASQEVGISKSNSMVFVVGYRYKVSFSWSETLKDIINYFEKK